MAVNEAPEERPSASLIPYISALLAMIGEGVLTLAQGERVAVWFAVWLPFGLGGVQIVSTCWRSPAWLVNKGSWRLLLGEFVFAGLMPVGLGLLDNHFQRSSAVFIGGAALLAAVALGYETVETKIAQRRPAGTASGTTKFASVQVGRVFNDPDTTIKTLAGNRGARLGPLKSWIEEDEQQAQLADPKARTAGGMRRAFAAILLAVAALPLGVGIARVIHAPPPKDHGSLTTQGNSGGSASPPPNSRRKGQRKSSPHTGSGTINASQPGSSPHATCSKPIGTPPRWAGGGIRDLLGLPYHPHADGFAGPAYGRAIDGVPSTFHSTTGPDGPFTWAVGIDRETCGTMSIMVDSDAFGPAVYLAPAVDQLRRLIDIFHLVGGVGRVSFDAGLPSEIYLIDTPAGTALLIRTDLSGDYTLLPPAAAAVFIEEVRMFGSWLWPIAVPGPPGESRIDLDVSPQTGNRKFSIEYNATTLAVISNSTVRTSGIPIPLDEIRTLIRSAAG